MKPLSRPVNPPKADKKGDAPQCYISKKVSIYVFNRVYNIKSDHEFGTCSRILLMTQVIFERKTNMMWSTRS